MEENPFDIPEGEQDPFSVPEKQIPPKVAEKPKETPKEKPLTTEEQVKTTFEAIPRAAARGTAEFFLSPLLQYMHMYEGEEGLKKGREEASAFIDKILPADKLTSRAEKKIGEAIDVPTSYVGKKTGEVAKGLGASKEQQHKAEEVGKTIAEAGLATASMFGPHFMKKSKLQSEHNTIKTEDHPTVTLKEEKLDGVPEHKEVPPQKDEHLIKGSLTDPLHMADNLYRIRQNKTAVETEIRKNMESARTDGLTREMGRKFRLFREGKETLTPEEAKVFNEKVQPLYDRSMKLYSKFRDEVDSTYNPRVALGHYSVWDKLIGGETTGGFRSGMGATPSILKGRKVFSMKDTNGNETIFTQDKGKAVLWKDGIPTHNFNILRNLKEGDKIKVPGLGDHEVVQAKESDVMEHSGIKYLDDDLAVQSIKLAELEKYDIEKQFLQDLKSHPNFSEIGTEDVKNIPQGWRKLQNAGFIPELRDVHFTPRIADVLDDYLRPGATTTAGKTAEGVSNVIVKSFMLDPIPHIDNEAWHWFTSRSWIDPRAYGRLATTLPEAAKSVLSQDKFQIELLRNGASLLYPSVRNQKVWQNLLREESSKLKTDPTIMGLAKTMGTSVGELLNRVSNKSSSIMWSARDVMYTQLVKEHMSKGKGIQEAIRETERYMPSYRLPDRVLGSRVVSEVMQMPVVSVFSRYHYGMLRSFGNALQDLRTEGRAMQGLDHLASYAIGWYLLYPLLDKIWDSTLKNIIPLAKKDDEVRARRAGGAHFIENLQKLHNNEIGYSQLATSILTPAPGTELAVSLWINRDPFTGRELIHSDDPLDVQIKDLTKVISGEIDPIKQFQKGQEGKLTMREEAAKLLDVELKTPEKKRRQHMQEVIKKRDRLKRAAQRKRQEARN